MKRFEITYEDRLVFRIYQEEVVAPTFTDAVDQFWMARGQKSHYVVVSVEDLGPVVKEVQDG